VDGNKTPSKAVVIVMSGTFWGSLKLAASLHLKMDGWNASLLLERLIFRGELFVWAEIHNKTMFCFWSEDEAMFCFGQLN